MNQSQSARNHPYKAILYSILFLFFFQLVSDFIEAIYVFGLLGTSLPAEIVCVLFFLSPVILLLLRKGVSGWPLVLIGEAALASRVVEVMLDTRGKMFVAGIGVGCFMLFFPALLRSQRSDPGESDDLSPGIGLTVALSLSILFRALGSGLDVSTYSWSQSIGWLLAIVAGALMIRVAGRAGQTAAPAPAPGDDHSPGLSKVIGLGLGSTSVFVLLYFAFSSPNVIARWSGVSYPLVIFTIVLALCLFALLLTSTRRLIAALTPQTVLVWNILFVLALASTILVHQIAFPPDADAYPLPEPPVTLLHHVPLILMLLLFPIILIDSVLFARELSAAQPSSRALGASFTIAALFLLLMIFAQIFTTVYDYIPVVGPFFRDKFWLVFSSAGIALTLPVLRPLRSALVSKNAYDFRETPGRIPNAFPGAILLVSLATLATVFLTTARPVEPGQKTSLRILTFNIQQGYNEVGLKNYDGQLGLIREVNADIVGLQESDTNRIANGNSDVVRYFADRLDMYSYYGPKTVPGTFGIALLSRYPIQNPSTFYMYSKGEQTATIQAQITVGGRTFDVFVTHLGNGGPIVQQEQILESLQGKEHIVLMGDFNFRPDTDQYKLTTATLDDSWLVQSARDANNPEIDPLDRIDHIFVSPGTTVVESRYLPGPHSDHPAMMTEIAW